MNHKSLEWVKAAEDDLDSAKELLRIVHLTNVVSFHSQQALEKLLKACLESRCINPPKLHNLITLNELVKEQNIFLVINEDLFAQINKLYGDSRYPGDLGFLPDGKPSIEEAKEFYNFALDVYEQVKKLLAI